MSRIVVVARTKMKSGVCCGALDLDTLEFLRIHNERGAHLTDDAPYQVGQVYESVYQTAWNARPLPHSEDKQFISSVYQHSMSELDLINFVNNNVLVYEGNLSNVFEGCLKLSCFSPYIDKDAVPSHSVCFWRSNVPLKKVISFGKVKYNHERHFLSYVGFQDPVDEIPEGTLIRLSLANWWSKDDRFEKKCYLQLSGWYGL